MDLREHHGQPGFADAPLLASDSVGLDHNFSLHFISDNRRSCDA